ncbi:hypothetical protein UY3_04052 [Chelonia mydas]|uniref:Uncharacterized protein n=1 Tax=Chelonia mydas TaxID=8469 RepID=M7C2V1_CHEMY|nr:hypothetical protein UY3_04052 [Chelonia mydas]
MESRCPSSSHPMVRVMNAQKGRSQTYSASCLPTEEAQSPLLHPKSFIPNPTPEPSPPSRALTPLHSNPQPEPSENDSSIASAPDSIFAISLAQDFPKPLHFQYSGLHPHTDRIKANGSCGGGAFRRGERMETPCPSPPGAAAGHAGHFWEQYGARAGREPALALLRRQTGSGWPISRFGCRRHTCDYYFHKLTPADNNYEILDKELLAIKVAFETLSRRRQTPSPSVH